IEGLPLFVEDSSRTIRRNLNGFRRRLRQLDSEHPELQVFLSEIQNKFEEELSSRGIDPTVFHYQILMNEREGGVAERFSFPQDEDFLDFLLEMAFDQNRAREVREQLTTFRHELIERNEQLKPELEYCRGMIVRLQKMVGVERDRSLIYSEIEVARRRVIAMSEWVTATLATLNSEQQQLQSTIRASKDAADTARKDADRSNRIAAVHRRHIAQLRFDTIQNEYVAAEQAHHNARRLKSIWYAARPLARVWEAKRRARQLREQLARKLQEHAPELAELTGMATRFANALEFEATALRTSETQERNNSALLKQSANAAQRDAAAFGERAATAESEVKRLRQLLERAEAEMTYLHEAGTLNPDELSDRAAAQRIAKEIGSLGIQIKDHEVAIVSKASKKNELTANAKEADASLRRLEAERADLDSAWNRANGRRTELETDAVLLRLLQTEKVDVQAAVARAVDVASEELRRLTDAILRI